LIRLREALPDCDIRVAAVVEPLPEAEEKSKDTETS